MDENEIQLKRRENEERTTAERARILGLPYLDTREFENEIALVDGLLSRDASIFCNSPAKRWRRRTLSIYGDKSDSSFGDRKD